MRESLCQKTVDEYAANYADGGEMDPITVYHDGNNYWLSDGFHRVFGAEKAKCKTIAANVLRGTREDARWAACAANKHGLHRSNQDKHKAVMAALVHPQGKGMSDRAIAQHVGVSNVFVSKIRGEVLTVNTSDAPETRTGRDGKEYPVPPKSSDPIHEPEDDRTLHEEEEDDIDPWMQDEPDDEEDDRRDGPPRLEEVRRNPRIAHLEEDDNLSEVATALMVKAYDSAVRQMIHRIGELKRSWEDLQTANRYTKHFYGEHELANFEAYLKKATFVVTAMRPHAVCGHCQGSGCDECGQSGVLPQNKAEAIL